MHALSITTRVTFLQSAAHRRYFLQRGLMKPLCPNHFVVPTVKKYISISTGNEVTTSTSVSYRDTHTAPRLQQNHPQRWKKECHAMSCRRREAFGSDSAAEYATCFLRRLSILHWRGTPIGRISTIYEFPRSQAHGWISYEGVWQRTCRGDLRLQGGANSPLIEICGPSGLLQTRRRCAYECYFHIPSNFYLRHTLLYHAFLVSSFFHNLRLFVSGGWGVMSGSDFGGCEQFFTYICLWDMVFSLMVGFIGTQI